MADTSKPPEQFTFRLRRYDPESGEAPYWDEHTIELAAPPLGARGDPAGPRPLRRVDRDPLLLPPGDLRLLRRARQRRTGPGLPHAPRRRPRGSTGRRHRDRADGQHAGAQGPDRGHGRRPLEEGAAGHAVAASTSSPCPSASTWSPTRAWSTSPSRWPASSAGRASRTAWRWRSTRASSARRRSPRPTASSATPATISSSSGSTTSPRTRRASSTAPTASSASRPAPRTSTRWARSCACAGSPRATSTSSIRTTASATRRRSPD